MQCQCCFCGAPIIGGQRPVRLSIKLADPDAKQALHCHGACLANALHPFVPVAFADAGIIYMPLLDEGIEVWRPVEAHKVGENRYKIPESVKVPDDENWAFQPGTTVLCKLRAFQDGTVALVTVAEAR